MQQLYTIEPCVIVNAFLTTEYGFNSAVTSCFEGSGILFLLTFVDTYVYTLSLLAGKLIWLLHQTFSCSVISLMSAEETGDLERVSAVYNSLPGTCSMW